MKTTMTVPDGYNGDTVELDLTPIKVSRDTVQLPVHGRPGFVRWVRTAEWWEALTKDLKQGEA